MLAVPLRCSLKACPASNTAASSPARPTNCSPTGKFFSVKPQGTESAGNPQRFPIAPSGSGKAAPWPDSLSTVLPGRAA